MSQLVVPRLKIRKKGTDLVREDGAKVVTVKNEHTGKRGGMLFHHGSGRVDGHATPDPVITKFGDVVDLQMSQYQKLMYEKFRAEGYSHEMALLKVPTPAPKRL